LLAKPEKASPEDREAVPTLVKYAIEPPIIAGFDGKRPTTSLGIPAGRYSAPGSTFSGGSPPLSPMTPLGSPSGTRSQLGSLHLAKPLHHSSPMPYGSPSGPNVKRSLF